MNDHNAMTANKQTTSHAPQDCCCLISENDTLPMAVSLLRSSKLWKWLLIVIVVLIPLLSLPMDIHFPRDPVDVEIKQTQVTMDSKPNNIVGTSTSLAPTQQPTTTKNIEGVKQQTPVSKPVLTQSPTLVSTALSNDKNDQVVVWNDKKPAVVQDDEESFSSDESISLPPSSNDNDVTVPPLTNTTAPPPTAAAGNDTTTTVPSSTVNTTSLLLPPYDTEKANVFQNKWCILQET
jgi:septal ring-binding cell division protein DamX